ncbi:MAG: hypothetical protein ABI616_12800 [Pseudomonadota bacterium]
MGTFTSGARLSVATLCLLLAGPTRNAAALEIAGAARSPGDGVVAGELIVEPPTLIALGFEWMIEGDDNRNATVDLAYRARGATAWKKALPLLRLQREPILGIGDAFTFVNPNMFAGSIFDLQPDTEYEVRFTLTDPDGASGEVVRTVTQRTRREPTAYAGGKVYHVYPPGYEGPKQEPSFIGLLGAYYLRANGADWFNAYPPRVVPGDTIIMHAGIYKADRYRYGSEPLGLLFDGTYHLRQSGTADKPITIKAAGDGEVVFDGNGNFNLFDVMAANYVQFEGLTIRNTEVGIQAGTKGLAGSVGLVVKNCRFEAIGRGIYSDYSGSKNFYIADNVFIGKSHPTRLEGWIGRTWQGTPGFPTPAFSELAVKVYGSGHVIAYNYVSNFHDGIDHATYGAPDGNPDIIRDRMPVALDIYNNDITNVDDNCIEADGVMHNARILRNRCFNQGHRALSTQPSFGGPVYFIRNVVYHAPEGGATKFTADSAGVLAYHNTLLAEVHSMGSVSNLHFRNNLILGEGAFPEIFAVDTYTNYSSSDFNGFRPNASAAASFYWNSPDFMKVSDFVTKPIQRAFKTLKEYSAATGQDRHSVLVDFDVFQNGKQADRSDPQRLHSPGEVDLRLRAHSRAIDAGVVLPGVNDGYTGRAPDLGAYEYGQPLPHYGPRGAD